MLVFGLAIVLLRFESIVCTILCIRHVYLGVSYVVILGAQVPFLLDGAVGFVRLRHIGLVSQPGLRFVNRVLLREVLTEMIHCRS